MSPAKRWGRVSAGGRRAFLAGLLAMAVGTAFSLLPPRYLLELGQPVITRGLPEREGDAQAEFDRRVREAYAGAASEEALRDRLEREGFLVVARQKLAVAQRDQFPCRLKWKVAWRSDGSGSLTGVMGAVGSLCP